MNYKELIEGCYALTALELSSTNRAEADAVLNEKLGLLISVMPALETYMKMADIDEYAELEPAGKDLRQKIEDEYKKDPSIKSVEMDQLNAFQRWFRVRSEPSYKQLERFAKTQAPSWMVKLFAKENGSQKAQIEALRTIVKKTSGKDATAYSSPEESAEMKEKYPDVYKEYLRLRREFNKVWQDALSNFVINSGTKTVSMKDAEAHLASEGFITTLSKGFDGRIDAAGNLYTEERYGTKPIVGKPQATLFPSVRMNPEYDPVNSPWVFQAIRSTGDVDGSYFYTNEFKKEARETKFDKVSDLTDVLDKARTKWIQIIRGYTPKDSKSGAAVVLEMLYMFSARIGSIGNEAAGKSTFGMSTLLVKHLADKGNKIVIRYLGKDAVKTVHELIADSPENKMVMKILRQLVKNKRPADFLFTYEVGDKKKRIGGNVVNSLFKSLIGRDDITVHKLRGAKGTAIAKAFIEEEFAKGTVCKTTAEALEWLKAVGERTGKVLNHVRRTKEGGQVVTGITALQSYIDPSLQVMVFQKWGLALPRYLDKMVN